MDRNAFTRLGSKSDFNEVLSHPFFKGIECEKILRREIEAPYKPSSDMLTMKEDEVISMDDPTLRDIQIEDA